MFAKKEAKHHSPWLPVESEEKKVRGIKIQNP